MQCIVASTVHENHAIICKILNFWIIYHVSPGIEMCQIGQNGCRQSWGRELFTVMAATGSYGLSPGDLRALMGKRKEAMVAALEDEGGTAGLMEKLKTSPEGLVGEEADLERRREVFGQNWIPASKSKSFLRLLWDAFLDPLLIILAIFALVGLVMSLYSKFSEEEGDEENLEWIETVSLQL